ncbi:MAG: HIT domain-containing protein [Candidatus Dormibacteria bacterium]
MERLWAPWRMEYVSSAPDPDSTCFICAAAEADELQPGVLTRDQHTVTLLNRFPYSSGHLMVCPRRHLPDITAVDAVVGAALFAGLQRAVAALQQALNPHAFNLGINQGAAAGGSVEDHLHIHVVPRWGGDTNFMPVVGQTKVLPELLTTTGDRLREAFAAQKP